MLHLLLQFIGYRRDVIVTNLSRSFPEKQYKEISHLRKDYYRHLARLVRQTLYLAVAPKKQAARRLEVLPSPFLEEIYRQGRSTLLLLGHYGNWEYMQLVSRCAKDTSFGPYPLTQTAMAYKKQSSAFFNRLFLSIRHRGNQGCHIVESAEVVRHVVRHRHTPFIYLLVADQCGPASSRHKTTFLNQESLMIEGPEVLARRFNTAVAYLSLCPLPKGRYRATVVPVTADPSTEPEGAILQTFSRLLEQDIREHPALWLWSHRRWKRRPDF